MRRILVIDDDKNFCHIVKAGLEARDSFHVVIAHDGKEGVKKAVEEKPDLILLDVVMDDIEGIEVAQALREDPRTESMPILFVTAMITEEELRKSTDGNGWFYLAKPIQINHLAETINKILKD
jgi:DNA-binding response OmpR family regulator